MLQRKMIRSLPADFLHLLLHKSSKIAFFLSNSKMDPDDNENKKKKCKKGKQSPAKKDQSVKKKSPAAPSIPHSLGMIGAPNLLPLLDLNLKSAPVPDSPPVFSLDTFLAAGDIGAAVTSPGNAVAFGFSPNAASRSNLNKDSILRLVTIDSPNGAYIVIRIEPVDERSGFIGERFLFDWSCVQIWINFMLSRLCTREGFFGRKKLDANFDRYEIPEKLEDDFDRYKIPEKLKRMLSKFERDKAPLNKSTLHWYENNIAKVNNKGGNIRLFSIHLGVPGLPELDSVINLAQYICAQINSVKTNNMTTRVVQAKLYWIPREECR